MQFRVVGKDATVGANRHGLRSRSREAMRRWFIIFVFSVAWALTSAACFLGPQPEPPEGTADAGPREIDGGDAGWSPENGDADCNGTFDCDDVDDGEESVDASPCDLDGGTGPFGDRGDDGPATPLSSLVLSPFQAVDVVGDAGVEDTSDLAVSEDRATSGDAGGDEEGSSGE